MQVFEPFSPDIWDRVRALGPSGDPVPGRLFRAAKPRQAVQNQPSEVVSDAIVTASIAPMRATPFERANLFWEQMRPAEQAPLDMEKSLQASVARHAETAVSQSFDQLRMRLLQTLKEKGWRRVAITSPTPGCGSTFVACNLAVSLSRIREQRTLLMDLNLRAPGVASAFGLACETDVEGLLSGRADAQDTLMRYKDNLAIGAGKSPGVATAEMLYDSRSIATLDRLENNLQPDVMLFDLPPMLAYDDVTAFLPQVDGVLLVSNGKKTMARDIKACERAIAGRTKLLGVVLNQVRKSESKVAGYRAG